MAGTEQWERVADYVARRMDELNIDQADLVRRSGMSDPTVRAIMAGTPRGMPRDKSRRRVSMGLGWSPGSIDSILDGGEPTVEASPTGNGAVSSPVDDDVRDRVARLEESLEEFRTSVESSFDAMAAEQRRLVAGMAALRGALEADP